MRSASDAPSLSLRRMSSTGIRVPRISPGTTWLATAPEKAHGLMGVWPSMPAGALPYVTVGDGLSRAVRLFPDRLPIGIDAAGRLVLQRIGALGASFHEAFRAELSTPLPSTVLDELR